ncbi:MAG: hypothetical protein EOP04_27175 [Proteobacteria bacterium]|nr:MAG: hypothetical protein EOP04_27175 [Pseudomonadota bacterium]
MSKALGGPYRYYAESLFLEDRKATAKRYKLESVDLFGPEWDSTWRIDADDEMSDSVVSDLYKAKIKVAYEDLKKAKPKATDKEISAAMAALKSRPKGT